MRSRGTVTRCCCNSGTTNLCPIYNVRVTFPFFNGITWIAWFGDNNGQTYTMPPLGVACSSSRFISGSPIDSNATLNMLFDATAFGTSYRFEVRLMASGGFGSSVARFYDTTAALTVQPDLSDVVEFNNVREIPGAIETHTGSSLFPFIASVQPPFTVTFDVDFGV